MTSKSFPFFLQKFFTQYLPIQRGLSNRTTDTYRYAFILYVRYLTTVLGIKENKLDISVFNYQSVVGFLSWLANEKRNGANTINSRKSALDIFAKFLILELPDISGECERIINLPRKRTVHREISYLKAEGVKLFFDQINIKKKSDLKIFTMLSLMFTTGIRVSELINIRVQDLHLEEPATLIVHGKGGKDRCVPIMKPTLGFLKKYLDSFHLNGSEAKIKFCFVNHAGEQYSRQGISYHVKRIASKARAINADLIPDDLSPHKIRHTTAMELLSSGVELIYIRDLLGHSSITTTETYAKVDSDAKRKALEKHKNRIIENANAEWNDNPSLIAWLESYGKR